MIKGLIQDQLGIIQNLQTSLMSKLVSWLGPTFFDATCGKRALAEVCSYEIKARLRLFSFRKSHQMQQCSLIRVVKRINIFMIFFSKLNFLSCPSQLFRPKERKRKIKEGREPYLSLNGHLERTNFDFMTMGAQRKTQSAWPHYKF